MKKQKLFTLEEIKKAYWVEFHETGDIWFDDLGTDEENEESTNEGWVTFVKELEKIKK